MSNNKKHQVLYTLKIDVDKCNGCRACEVICYAFHATRKNVSNNPESLFCFVFPKKKERSSERVRENERNTFTD